MNINKKKILFAILAGGQSKRFGGGLKAFAKINGITILDKIINKLKKYSNEIIINANDLKSYKKIKHNWIYEISKKITLTPSLYLETGAIHGCAIIHNNKPLIYMEDVGRHNAVDKIAGFMFLKKISSSNKIFYTTGRLTSEMIIKTIKMGIPILISRSGFTAWGVELARGSNLTLIGRAKGKKYLALSGEHRIEHK